MTDYMEPEEDVSSLTSEESHEPYFNTHTGAILTAREAWTILSEHDDRYRLKLQGLKQHHNEQRHLPIDAQVEPSPSLTSPQPSNDEIASLGPTQSNIDRALHPDLIKPIPSSSSDEESDPDILRAQAMALAAANGQKLTPEQILLIARPDVQQQKLIEETRKAKKATTGGGLTQIGADIKKFIEAEKEKSAIQWGSDLGRFIEEQSIKLQGGVGNVVDKAIVGGEGKKKMEGFGTDPSAVDTEEKEQQEPTIISAVLWKRRSGLGKHSTIKAWEKRLVELRGSKLMYYETAEEVAQQKSTDDQQNPRRISLFEQAAHTAEYRLQSARDELTRMAVTVGLEKQYDSNTPRGILDVVKEKATVCASIGHSGSPTPFCLSIKVKSETKWKFCFESHGMLMEWLEKLNEVVVRESVRMANEEEGDCWVIEESGDVDDARGLDVGPVALRSFSRQLSSYSAPKAVSGGDVGVTEIYLKIALVLSNFALILSRSSVLSIERWWTLVVFFNFGMYHLYNNLIQPPKTSTSNLKDTKPISLDTSTREKRTNAIAGSSCQKVSSLEDPIITQSDTKLPLWIPITTCDMEVRGHDYLTTKKKIPSPGELYECIAVDCFQSDNRVSEMSLRVVLPEVEFKDEGVKRWKAPDLFVVSIAIPTEVPAFTMGKTAEDGPGTTIVGYFKMKESTRSILRRITADDYDPSVDDEDGGDSQKQILNGVKLWEKYCNTAPNDASYQARFKLIPQLNMDELGCPSYISKYNGKPVLIKRNQVTGFFTDYPHLNAMEFDISLHPFPYLFKQAMAYLKDNYFDKAVATFGFVIEGRSDDELPEVIIGAMRACHFSSETVISEKDFFGKGD